MEITDRDMYEKLKAGEPLTGDELEAFVYGSADMSQGVEVRFVSESFGAKKRWTQEVHTVARYNDRYWAIDWLQGLTEECADIIVSQPYEVEPHLEVIPEHTVTTYRRIGE